jgi:RNA polymerase sigma-70 factor (ECF subfamily)
MTAELESTLIDRLRACDTSALEMLMERHAGRLYRVAFGITRDHSDADEVVQDVFLTLFNKVDSFEGRAALGSWLYRVTTNAALIKCRGKRAQVEMKLEDCLPTYLADGHRAGERSFLLADWSQNPEEDLLSKETRVTLERAIRALPEHYRAVLILRDVEELPNEEIAGIVGESVAAVKSRLHRARMALRELLTRSLAPARDN